MNKRFLKVAFLCLVACSVSASFTSCKDYDEDINSLRQETSGLSGQLSALEEALNSTKTELTNAKKAADDAMAQAKAAAEAAQAADAAAKAAQAAGDSAKAEAEAAKAAAEAANAQALAAEALAKEAQAAAAKAKEEAIAEAVAKCQELMASTVSDEEFNQKVSELEGMIDAVEAGLNTLEGKVGTIDEKVKALTEWQTSVDLQLKTLETLQAEVGTLKSDVEEVKSSLSGLEGTVSGLSESLTALQGTVDSLEETIAELQELVDTKASKEEVEAAISSMETGLKEYVDGAISDLDEALKSHIDDKLGAYATTEALNTAINGLKENMVTLADALTWRLTSLALIPEVYEDGIPTMSFRTLVYTPKKLNDQFNLVNVPGAKSVSLGNDETTVSYYVNPSKITESYIGKPSFVTAVATTRAGSLIDVKGYKIEDGKLTVTAVRTTDASFNEGLENDEINIFALKVPLAENALTDAEKKAGAEVAVYSQFAKFAQTTFTPYIVNAENVNDKLASYKEAYAAGKGGEILLDAKYDETTDLLEYVSPAYNNEFMELDYLKSFGVTLRFSIPKDAYELGDSNTDQQKFVSVTEFGKLTAKNLSGGADLSSAIGREPIVCVQMVDTLNGKNNTVDQRYFKVRFVKEKKAPIKVSYEFDPFKLSSDSEYKFTMPWDDMTSLILEKTGLSYDEFEKTYTEKTVDFGSVEVDFDYTAVGSSPITWTLTAAEVGTVKPDEVKTLEAVLTLSDVNGMAPEITINMSVKVSVELPTMAGLNTIFWKNNAYQLKHVPYESRGQAAKAFYSNEILEGFNLIDDVYMLSTKGSYNWEFQFSEEGQLDGYVPNGKVPSMQGRYLVPKGISSSAAVLEYDPQGLFASATPNPKFRLPSPTYAKPLVGQTVSVTAWVKFNEYNAYELNSYKIEILSPLKFVKKDPTASFKDWTANSTVSVKDLITVSETGTNNAVGFGTEIANYYNLQNAVYDVANAKIGMKEEGGNLVVDDNLTGAQSMSLAKGLEGATLTLSGTDLKFTHTTGAQITKACNIFVPFKVVHYWGEFSGYVKVRLNPLS